MLHREIWLVKLKSFSFLANSWLIHQPNTRFGPQLFELIVHEWLHLFLDLLSIESENLSIKVNLLLNELIDLALFHKWEVFGQKLERILLFQLDKLRVGWSLNLIYESTLLDVLLTQIEVLGELEVARKIELSGS